MVENPHSARVWLRSNPLPSRWLSRLISDEAHQHGGQAFWRAVSQICCPVLETMEEDPLGQLLLTFVWRGGSQSHPWLIGGPSADHLPLWQIEGSDIWFRTIAVPHDLVLAYRFAQVAPHRSTTRPMFRRAVSQSLTPDPLNPNILCGTWQGHQEAFSIIAPGAKEGAEVRFSQISDLGVSHRFSFHSPILNTSRDIYIQAPPPDLTRSDPQRLLLLLDGERSEQVMQLPAYLATAQSLQQIPATTTVYVGAANGQTRAQVLGCNPKFAHALSCELMPLVEKRLGRSFLPSETQIAGASLGGLAALHTALLYPGRFQQVIALSGSFWWPAPREQEPGEVSGNVAVRGWEISDVGPKAGLHQLRVRLSVGCYETGGLFGRPDMVAESRRVKKYVQELGAEVELSVSSGGHDPALWRHRLLQDLQSLS